ncbi:hypothetical protein [Paenibacillus aquistagni]
MYKAWTDPKHLPMWWGPQGWTLTVCMSTKARQES